LRAQDELGRFRWEISKKSGRGEATTSRKANEEERKAGKRSTPTHMFISKGREGEGPGDVGGNVSKVVEIREGSEGVRDSNRIN